MTAESVAMRIVNRLSQSGFRTGEETFEAVFRRYAKLSRKGRLPGDPTYSSTVSMRVDPTRKEPLLVDITKVVMYAHEPEKNHALRAITSEWANRTVAQQEKIRNLGQEYLEWRNQPRVGAGMGVPLFGLSPSIISELRKMPVEKGLDFLAVVAAQWSYRFQPAGYLDYFNSLGWPMLESLHISDFIGQTAIMFIAMAWQVEDHVPIYWQLIKARRNAS